MLSFQHVGQRKVWKLADSDIKYLMKFKDCEDSLLFFTEKTLRIP